MRLVPSLLALFAAFASPARAATVTGPPNVVIIFADDLGYGDLGCHGHPSIRTPNLDRMASEGLRFTDFYVAESVCSPSRAALLTGRYPVRSGMFGRRRVLFPDSEGGLPGSEITIAELLRDRGYATAHIGKWHLGIHGDSVPQRQGFDFSFGLPYSNDMDRREDAPANASGSATPPPDGWDVPLIRNGEIVERPAEQTTLTRRYTEEAIRFIREGRGDRPFLLYLAHTFPHVPVFASEGFRGKSRRGIYGDTVEEIDWSVGQVLAELRAAGIAENTFVFFTSDNGPWLIQDLQGGSAGLLSGGKGTTWEGGMRVPGIAWWPSRIRPDVTSTPANAMDLFATIGRLAGARLPTDRAIDGIDLSPLLFERGQLPEHPFFYYHGATLAACRLGEFKLHFSTQRSRPPWSQTVHEPPLLFHLGRDPAEQHDIATEHPDIVQRIEAAVAAHRTTVRAVPPQFD